MAEEVRKGRFSAPSDVLKQCLRNKANFLANTKQPSAVSLFF